MKLFNARLEFGILKNVCDGVDTLDGALLNKLHAGLFHSPAAKLVYKRVSSLSSASGKIPDYGSLLVDPALDEYTRGLLRKAGKDKISSEQSIVTLSRYAQLRELYFTATETIKDLQEDSIEDIDSLIEKSAERLNKARALSSSSASADFIHIGASSNAESFIRQYLKTKKDNVIPTGFKSFDGKNSGFRRGSLVILSANTGGLKSALAKQYLLNTYRSGYNSCYISLEMTEEQTFNRVFSSRTGISHQKFYAGKLSRQDKIKVWKSYKEMEKDGQAQNNRFSVLSTMDDDLTMNKVIARVQPLGYDVVLVDYISLLAESDTADQWKSLLKVARLAKLAAKRSRNVYVLLAQLSEENTIRFSKGITDHCDNWWHWRIGEEERGANLFTVNQGKARDQATFPFQLEVDFDTMTISDPKMDRMESLSGEDVGNKTKAKKAVIDTSGSEDQYYVDEV